MKRLAFLFGHLALFVAAYRWSHSTSGFLVTGPGLALLLDRYVTRLLPWTTPLVWKKELTRRAGWALVGGIGFYCMRPGIVPVEEAVYRGAIVSLAVFLMELLVGPISRGLGGPAGRVRWCCWSVLLALFGLVMPVLAALHPLHTVPKRTPASFGLEFEDVRFQTADGLQLAGWLVPHPQARGNVIFCHGHGRNRGHVAGLLETLHDVHVNVLAFDFRGHGDSDGHTSTFGHREVADLLAAEAYVRERCPGQPLFLIGISLGAAVSLQALPQLRDVHGVWLEGCFSHLSHPIRTELTWTPACLRGPLFALYNGLGWADCGFRARRIRPIDALKQVQVPIYFVHGQRDELVPCTDGRELYTACTCPKWCWWVEDATHYNVRQQHQAEYLRRLREFLADRLVEVTTS